MKLYDYPKSGNGYKVRLLLGHLNQSYEYIPLDILRGETRTERFLRKNPNGRIPLLELDDETFLPESNAILFFLAQGSRYWPSPALEQAQALQWLFFEQYSHESNIATARFWVSIKGLEDTPFNHLIMNCLRKSKNKAAKPLRSWKPILITARSLPATITPSPILRSMPIPMWLGREASLCRITLRFAIG